MVDLGGAKAAANPLGVALSGLAAKAVTRGSNLVVIPANRARIAADWLLDAVLPRQTVQLGLVRGPRGPTRQRRRSRRRRSGKPSPLAMRHSHQPTRRST